MENQEIDYKKILSLILRKRWLFVGTALLIMSISVIVSYLLPKVYESKSTVFIEKNVISELVRGIAITPSMEQTLRVIRVAMTSRPLLEKVINELDMLKGKGPNELPDLLEDINKQINVTVNNDNSMFIISYRNSDPRLARDFVNTLVRFYIEQNVSSKREESYGAIQFMSEQAETVKKKIEVLDKEINQYKAQQGGVINVDEPRLFTEINAAQQRLHEVQLRRRQLEGLKPITRREADPLNNQLLTLQRRQDELRSQFNENYPELLRIKGEIESLQKQIKSRPSNTSTFSDPVEVSRIESELNALKISEQTLSHSIATNQNLLKRIPSAKAGLEQIEAELRTQKTLYDQLLSRQGQSEVSKQIEVQDKTTTYRIVEPAIIPIKPVKPNRVKIMLFGLIAGVAGGVGILIGIDFLDKSIKSVDAIKSLGLQILAVVPQIPDLERELKLQKRNRIFSAFSLLYFGMVLIIIVLEAAGLPYIDKLIFRMTSSF